MSLDSAGKIPKAVYPQHLVHVDTDDYVNGLDVREMSHYYFDEDLLDVSSTLLEDAVQVKSARKDSQDNVLKVGGISYTVYSNQDGCFAIAGFSDPVYLGKTPDEFRRAVFELKMASRCSRHYES